MIAAEKASFPAFAFDRRNRRPPADPLNAMLSFAYALATRLFTGALTAAGLDPYQGFYHAIRPGRPALSLDMMEPFRPILCDSTVLLAVNNGELDAGGLRLQRPVLRHDAERPEGADHRLGAPARAGDHAPRLWLPREHAPNVAVQCRLLARHLAGEITEMPHYVPR